MTWAVVGLAVIAMIAMLEFVFLCIAVAELMDERRANMHLHTLIDREMSKNKRVAKK